MRLEPFLSAIRPLLGYHVFSSRQLAVLLLLAEAEDRMDFGALARDLRISKPAVCRVIDVLLKLSMVDRRPNPKDNRKVFVGITRGGWELLQRMGVS